MKELAVQSQQGFQNCRVPAGANALLVPKWMVKNEQDLRIRCSVSSKGAELIGLRIRSKCAKLSHQLVRIRRRHVVNTQVEERFAKRDSPLGGNRNVLEPIDNVKLNPGTNVIVVRQRNQSR